MNKKQTKFMKANYSKLLTTLAGIAGLTGASLLITLPSVAKEVLNPHPSIFNESPYNRGQRIQANAKYTNVEASVSLEKDNAKPAQKLTQNDGGVLNPSPSIFNDPRYRRRRDIPTGTTPIPNTTPFPNTTPGATPTPPTEIPTPIPPSGTSNTQGKNLVAVVESNPSFKTLTQALKAAGLLPTLQGKDNFTIFAPTDAAFAKLPPEALRDLLKPENKEVLLKILTYHVVPGNVLSTDLKSGQVKSVEGDPINVDVKSAGVTVNDAKVIQTDIRASNGVIHVIDNVILPPSL